MSTLTRPCPKHGPHYLLHSEANLDESYAIPLPTSVYTINEMLESANATSTLSRTSNQVTGEYPLSLDTIYPNPSNTSTILNKTISWVPLPLINESVTGPVNAGFIYIDPLKPLELNSDQNGDQSGRQ
ncbi:unnamed protein product [Echinostoma caproni]|uniref:Uncharacterized protein n=1 Tax=Echinostoma caproni TaxID=27848 RepID=A0A183AA10_9TREM|nr:unnamed protein product [Echinostoma caproni]